MLDSVEKKDLGSQYEAYKNMKELMNSITDASAEVRTKTQKSTPSKMEEEEIIAPVPKPSKASTGSSVIKDRIFGINNIGNTCFFNSTMQAMNATRELVNYYVTQEEFYNSEEVADLLYSMAAGSNRRNKKPERYLCKLLKPR